MATLSRFLKSLNAAADNARAWFFATASLKTRSDYFAKGKLGDRGKGAVYVYLDGNDQALYVGEASRPIKRRMHDQTSPHKGTPWWESWEKVRLLEVHERTDRLTLELLLILACKPEFNRKPGSREIQTMFASPTLK